MKHVFIINPAAGKNQAALSLVPTIRELCEVRNLSYEILTTTAPGEATVLAQTAISKAEGETVRLYACGGDGTLLEVLTGMTPGGTAQLAHIPCGSGNDFVRMLGGAEPYLNLEDMMDASAYAVDGIVCMCGDAAPRRALNVAATGMDAEVAYRMDKFKHWPLVSGPMAYNLALVKVFFSRLGCQMTVTMDTPEGEVTAKGRYLFALCANGEYYGGGYHSAPMARPDDGLLDFILVDKISRWRILGLLPKYKNGTHVGNPAVHITRGTAMTVQTEHPMPVTLDGECVLTDRFRVEVQPAAYFLVVPDAVARARGMAQPVEV